MPLFDSIAIVDWSASATPSPKKPSADAIWTAVARGGAVEAPAYRRTRAETLAWLGDHLAAERAAGRRALVGFDFPFGYPAGFARAITGEARAPALWAHLAARITDGPTNANNRFAVAAALNAALPGLGPFWGRPDGAAHPALPARGTERRAHGMAERRAVEMRAPRAQPCWKLYTVGSVGSQALLGIAALERLRADPRLAGALAVWPFDTGLSTPDAPLVLAEIYPSLLDAEMRAARGADEVKDATQVRIAAAAYAALDRAEALAPLFSGAPDITAEEREAAEAEEAWILGVGHEAALRDAATAPAPRMRNDCFALPPGMRWTPVDEALARLRASLSCVVGVETVALEAADGRFLAAPVLARRDHPPEPNAAVDGYAFARASLPESGPARLTLAEGRSAAGAPWGGVLPGGMALRILTGATAPEGADTVALQEDVEASETEIRLEAGLKRGANLRRAGENLKAGDEAAPTGRRLGPSDLAQIAAGGVGAVSVRKRLRVGVLSTGDELVAPEDAQGDSIADSNRPMLLAMLARMGFAPVDLGRAPDADSAVRAALDAGAARADAILTSGGASAGDEDHLSRLLNETGSMTLWRIAMKPGRPLALGLWRGAPVFGLPGNPVAAFVCTLLFARPALTRMAGGDWPEPRALTLPAAFEKRKKAGRREYLRARIGESGAVETFRSEGSGLIGGLVWSEGLVELPDAAAHIRPGDPVRFLPYPALGL